MQTSYAQNFNIYLSYGHNRDFLSGIHCTSLK